MRLPAGLVWLRSAVAQVMGRGWGFWAPVRLRLMRFIYEVAGRSQIRGRVAPGVQFIGLIAVEGTQNVHVGGGTRIGRRSFLKTAEGGVIEIGKNVTINDGATIVAYDRIEIGDNVMIGEYVTIRDANHGMARGVPVREQAHEAAPVRIGADAWLARGVCVLKGVCVGVGAVVGANSVVTKDIPDYAIAVGAPAKVIGERKP